MKPFRLTPAEREADAEDGPPASGGAAPGIKILLVDDQPANLLALESLLDGGNYSIVKASSGAEGLRCLLKEEFALVLLDVLMPGMDGFETAAMIRDRQQSRETPIIFITASNTNENHVSRGYSLGAVDYIYKPIVPEILKAKVRVFADLHQKTQLLKLNERALRREFDEHRKTAERRRESEEKYRELFSRATDAIILFGEADGLIVDANDAALKLYGYSSKAFMSLRARDLVAHEGKRRRSRRAGLYHRAKDGREFPVELTRASLEIQGRAMTMILTRDLTERAKAEEAERLREREVMQRKMIATVSHELRTPIAVIKASAETLRRGDGAQAKAGPRFLKIIVTHADRLSGIVENLLTEAEIESKKVIPKPELVHLKTFVEQFVKDMAPLAARKGISIRENVQEDLNVWMDHGNLTCIFQNLLDNAIKYNKWRGSVRVEARLGAGRQAHVLILDSGIGIGQDDLPRIFNQFYRAEAARALAINGTGLGLSILKTLVEANGGRIWAESVEGKGSLFHFTMPLAEPVRPKRQVLVG